jgi:hypothetical protein
MNTIMHGTSGAAFTVVAEYPTGRLGYRSIGDGKYRVRVEPANGLTFSFPGNWKAPTDGYNRYSTVVPTGQLEEAIALAQRFLGNAAIGQTTKSTDTAYKPAPPPPPHKVNSLEEMLGTTYSAFRCVGKFPAGRIGYREHEPGQFRIRVEPASGVNLEDLSDGWTQPDGSQNRYSKTGSDLADILAEGTAALVSACI